MESKTSYKTFWNITYSNCNPWLEPAIMKTSTAGSSCEQAGLKKQINFCRSIAMIWLFEIHIANLERNKKLSLLCNNWFLHGEFFKAEE